MIIFKYYIFLKKKFKISNYFKSFLYLLKKKILLFYFTYLIIEHLKLIFVLS